MFSYLQGIRPNNRRTTPHASIPQSPSTRHYHEAPTYAKESPYDSLLHRSTTGSTFPSESPVSPVPPILPPIPRVASQHDSYGRVDSGRQSPDLRPSKPEGQRGDYQDPSNTTSADSDEVRPPRNNPIRTSKTLPTQPLYLNPASLHQLHDGTYRPINATYDTIKPSAIAPQSVSRPTSTADSINIPQPRRPPPPPPTHSSQPETSSTNSGRHGRTKLNLLNPMSLLARRRSSQAVTEAALDKALQTKSQGIPSLGLPDDYDPRIRGKVVHDFSAPRLGRNYASNDINLSVQERSRFQDLQKTDQRRLSPNLNSLISPEEDSPNSTEREHTPIFKEHFDDDIELGPSVRSGTAKYGASAFMYQLSLTESHPDPDPSSIPAFARNLPPRVSSEGESNDSSLTPPKIPLEVVHESKLIDRQSAEISAKPSPPVSPPRIRSRASSNSDSPFQSAGLPKHFKSNASRFSFDLSGVGSSAQEKLLEEKHRQKAQRNARQSDTSTTSFPDCSLHGAEDDDDGYNYEDTDDDSDDNGLEERIPGVNADAEDALPILNQHLESFHPTSTIKSSLTSSVSPVSTDMTSLSTPRDNHGQPIDFAISKLSPNLEGCPTFDTSGVFVGDRRTEGLALNSDIGVNLGIHCHPLEGEDDPSILPRAPLAGLPPSQHHYPDDDFYFDDGMIEDIGETDVEAFDESIFDDMDKPSSIQSEKGASRSRSSMYVDKFVTSTDVAQLETRDSFLEMNRKNRTSFNQASNLTQDNLEAYHDALAFATNQAALNGEFNRRQSFDPQNRDGNSDDLPGMTPDDGRGSQEINEPFPILAVGSVEDFDFDDSLSDDPIIAAANAEALENDDDGFYGQEFGFFARSTDSGEYANGGYFGPRGVEGIGRSHSGRVNFQEPSLTPITERSEWSNRNSAISLAILGYPQSTQPALPSPGLAQLADMLPIEDDNMSLSALMKLRRGAWGGSTTSLQSSSGSQISGSPLNILPTIPSSTAALPTNSIHAHNFTSTHSLASSSGLNSGSDSDASPSSPTITISTNNTLPSAKYSRSESSPNLPLPLHNSSDAHTIPARPRSSHLVGKVMGHSRNNSGAESVSYVHEKDVEGSSGRWVVEKRRLGEDGKVEILEREVLEGGRI